MTSHSTTTIKVIRFQHTLNSLSKIQGKVKVSLTKLSVEFVLLYQTNRKGSSVVFTSPAIQANAVTNPEQHWDKNSTTTDPFSSNYRTTARFKPKTAETSRSRGHTQPSAGQSPGPERAPSAAAPRSPGAGLLRWPREGGRRLRPGPGGTDTDRQTDRATDRHVTAPTDCSRGAGAEHPPNTGGAAVPGALRAP